MAYIQKDRVKETTTTNGTGAVTLAGAVAGFQAFSAVMSVADTCYYVIVSATGTDWETGTGTYSSASVLTRTTVLSSSNSGNAVSFTSGTKDVFMGPVAERVTDIAHGGTGATTAADARTNLGVSTGTVTSVSGAGTVSGLTLTGTVTSSGSLTLGGTLSAIPLATGVSGTLPVANGGTGVTTSTGTTNVVLSNSPTLVTPLSNSLSAVPVASGAGNSLTIAAGSGIGTGSGANLVLNPGEFATSGTRGSVLIDGLTVGQGKVSGVQNTVVGIGALAAITTAYGNVAVGFGALAASTTTGQNVAVGQNTLAGLTGGYNNVAIGDHALYQGTGAFTYNIGIGKSALSSVNGSNNIGIGGHAGEQGGSGSGSIYIGFLAGRYAAASNNVVIGNTAGFTGTNLTSGASNVLVGAYTNIGTGNAAATNCIIIGANAVGNGSNTTTIGNTSTTATWLYGYVKSTVYTVATLTAAATAGAGARAFVSDSNATTFAAIVAGGGANGVPIYSDGTNWRIG